MLITHRCAVIFEIGILFVLDFIATNYSVLSFISPVITKFKTPTRFISEGRKYANQLSVLPPSASSIEGLTNLPKGISPFERAISKGMDIQGDIRTLAKKAIDAASFDGVKLIEVEFPPLVGGDKSKSQFDDFDNIQELEKNKEWAMQLAPEFTGKKEFMNGKTWLVFPDLKECELARTEWKGARYQAVTFTTIQVATEFLAGKDSFDAPWGSALVEGISSIIGGEKGDAGLLGDKSSVDNLVDGENSPAEIYFIIQPGNGGPVEDWINCEKMHLSTPDSTMVIINGALDKVRGGYYPSVFFPKLAETVDRFFKQFESVFYLKPISDKGVYGWLYRVYPEAWQVILQKPKNVNGQIEVKNVVVHTSKFRPDYSMAVEKLLQANDTQ